VGLRICISNKLPHEADAMVCFGITCPAPLRRQIPGSCHPQDSDFIGLHAAGFRISEALQMILMCNRPENTGI
jgi:hypothetical protein